MSTRVFSAAYLDCYADDRLVEENDFKRMKAQPTTLPQLSDPAVRAALPQPFWDGARGAAAVAAYWKTWELAFANLRTPTPDNKFIAPYIDTAFK
jgi:hypothetical protein